MGRWSPLGMLCLAFLSPSILRGFPRVTTPICLSICQNVKRAPRASRICGRKGRRWKMRDSRAPEPGQLVGGNLLLLDTCMREGKLVRKRKQGASAVGASGFLFAFPAEGDFPKQIEK